MRVKRGIERKWKKEKQRINSKASKEVLNMNLNQTR